MTEQIKKLNIYFAAKSLLLFSAVGVVFHFFVLLRVIPYAIVWGGRATNENFYTLEAVSLAILCFLAFIVAGRVGYLRLRGFAKFFYFGCWVIFIMFLLNTLGNFTSPVPVERYFFSMLTLITSLFVFRLIVE